MAFSNLYSKSTANPKDIDFARIGTVVKNKIPEAAVKAFHARFPSPLPKPFDFAFDTDRATGKLQITVKKAGADFVFGWTDAEWAQNKAKLEVVEDEIKAWKTRLTAALQKVYGYEGTVKQITERVAALESKAGSGQADNSILKEVEAAKAEMQKLRDEANALHTQVVQFWNAGPKDGVLALIKKHGLPGDKLGEERTAAFAAYKVVQQVLTEFVEDHASVGKDVQALQARLNDVGVRLVTIANSARNRADELESAVVDIQKTIGEVQGYARSDFEGLKTRELIKEGKEFAAKSGAAWTRLAGDPAAIDKAAARNQEVFQQLRILGARVKNRYDAWREVPVGRAKALEKYQAMLKMVHDEYMQELGRVQAALNAYSLGLEKQKIKAQAEIDKAAKASAKATAKAEAKAAKSAKKK
jgi:hypothetical protein